LDDGEHRPLRQAPDDFRIVAQSLGRPRRGTLETGDIGPAHPFGESSAGIADGLVLGGTHRDASRAIGNVHIIGASHPVDDRYEFRHDADPCLWYRASGIPCPAFIRGSRRTGLIRISCRGIAGTNQEDNVTLTAMAPIVQAAMCVAATRTAPVKRLPYL